MSPIDVLIAVPISGAEYVYYEWSERTTDMIMNIPQGLKVGRQRFPEPCIDISRDKAVNMAIQVGARWLFFLDSDVIVPPNTLERLIAHNKEIVGGLYVRRHNPPFNEMLKFRTDGQPGLRPVQDGEYQPGSLLEVDAIATGCMLIRTDVFDKVQPYQQIIDGQPARGMWFLWTEWRTINGVGYSEDFSFCTKARQHGIKIYCDTSIKCKHQGPIRFVPSGTNNLQIEFAGDPIRW